MRDWIIDTALAAYTIIGPIFGFLALLAIFVFIPMGFFDSTRRISALYLTISSFVFGLTTWLFAVAITFSLLGTFWLIVGLLIAGIGVIPLGFIAAMLNGLGDAAFGIAFGFVLTVVAKVLGNYWGEKAFA